MIGRHGKRRAVYNVNRMKMSRGLFVVLIFFLGLSSCNDATETDRRTYRMGFQNSAPRFDDFDMFVQSLSL
jgi:hypothetical protein